MRRTQIGFLRAVFLTGVFAAFAIAPAVASAAGETYFAASYGSGEACTKESPCTLIRSLQEAAAGDSVVLSGIGEFTLESAGLTISEDIDIGGEPGFPAHIVANSPNSSLHVLEGAGATVHDIWWQGSNLRLESGVAERVRIAYPGLSNPLVSVAACELGDGAVLRDSVCWADETGGVSQANGVQMLTSDEGTHRAATLRNVDAIATDAEGHGLMVIGGASETTVDATNVIARAANAADVVVRRGFTFARVNMNFENSNYATVEEETPRALVTPAGSGGNQTAAPLFADPVNGDFTELEASPTIDAGLAGLEEGAFDLAGNPRSLPGCKGAASAPDIGAYEFQTAKPCPVPKPPPPEEKRPEPPKPQFRILKVAVHGSSGFVQLEAPSAGMVTLTGSGVKLVTRQITGPQVMKLPLKPWAITLVRLKKTGKTKVHVKVQFAESGGAPREMRRTVQFKRG